MRSIILSSTLALANLALGSDVHGQGGLGNSMGPVDFLFPQGRPWSADADNTAPCGSVEGPTARTDFPLNQGTVSLSIADEAWNVEFYLSLEDDPTSMSDFQAQVVQDVARIEPGHQCYTLRNMPSNIALGTPATLQMRYWAEYEGENKGDEQSFYACADIVFAEVDAQAACFNVTTEEFPLEAPSSDSGSSSGSNSNKSDDSSSEGGLSTGAKAGIAVGTIVASLGVVGAIAFLVFRRRRSSRAPEEVHKDVEEISHA